MKNSKLNLAKVTVSLILLGLLSLVACNKGGDGGGGGTSAPAAPPSAFGGCPNCGVLGGGVGLLNGVQAVTPDGTVSFLLNSVGVAGFDVSNPKNVVFYNGPAGFWGTMNVTTASPTWCWIPAGTYTIQPLELSNFGWLMMMGGRFEALGPIAISFRVSSAVFFNTDGGGVSTASPNNRANMSLMIESVNGYSCGMMSTY